MIRVRAAICRDCGRAYARSYQFELPDRPRFAGGRNTPVYSREPRPYLSPDEQRAEYLIWHEINGGRCDTCNGRWRRSLPKRHAQHPRRERRGQERPR